MADDDRLAWGTDGWDALTDALDVVHAGVAPVHWSTAVRFSDGGTDPLDGVSAYRVDGPAPHWHYVGYGLSDLYGPGSAAAPSAPAASSTGGVGRSGWGVELTMRLAAVGPWSDEAPRWPADLLQNAARYVRGTGRAVETGQVVDLHEPLTTDVPTLLRALLFVTDPELGEILTPLGKVRFVQVVGITGAELDAVRRWNVEGFAVLLQSRDSMLITDVGRASITDEPWVDDAVLAGIARDGSSTEVLLLREGGAEIGRDGLVITVAREGVANLVAMLRGRLGFDRPLSLASRVGDFPVLFRREPPNPQDDQVGRWVASNDIVEVWLTDAGLDELAAGLEPRAGRYGFPSVPDTLFEVVP